MSPRMDQRQTAPQLIQAAHPVMATITKMAVTTTTILHQIQLPQTTEQEIAIIQPIPPVLEQATQTAIVTATITILEIPILPQITLMDRTPQILPTPVITIMESTITPIHLETVIQVVITQLTIRRAEPTQMLHQTTRRIPIAIIPVARAQDPITTRDRILRASHRTDQIPPTPP